MRENLSWRDHVYPLTFLGVGLVIFIFFFVCTPFWGGYGPQLPVSEHPDLIGGDTVSVQVLARSGGLIVVEHKLVSQNELREMLSDLHFRHPSWGLVVSADMNLPFRTVR